MPDDTKSTSTEPVTNSNIANHTVIRYFLHPFRHCWSSRIHIFHTNFNNRAAYGDHEDSEKRPKDIPEFQ